jgi:hypothetical protein
MSARHRRRPLLSAPPRNSAPFANASGVDSDPLGILHRHNLLAEFPSTGPIPITEPDGANQRLAILFAILASMNAHADELTGPVLDCLDRYDVTATVTIRDGDISMETEGLPWTLH